MSANKINFAANLVVSRCFQMGRNVVTMTNVDLIQLVTMLLTMKAHASHTSAYQLVIQLLRGVIRTNLCAVVDTLADFGADLAFMSVVEMLKV